MGSGKSSRRPWESRVQFARPFSRTPVENAHERLGTVIDVLARRGIRVRRGRKIRCPFDDHPDTTPSFAVRLGDNGRERFKCFGCGREGDAIDLEALLSNRSIEDVIHGR
jgi:hypothetical protein